MGWVHRPTAESLWDGESFWRGLQALPQRPEWSYQDDAPSFYDPLDAPQVVVPGLADRYRQTWLGAEAGVRSLLPSEVLKPDRSYLLEAADWVTTVQRSRGLGWSHLRSVMPGHSQRTPLEMLPTHSWTREPFSETCGGLRRALICSLLWPGQIQRAKVAAFFDASDYTGVAQTAQAWLAIVAALMITDPDPNLVNSLRSDCVICRATVTSGPSGSGRMRNSLPESRGGIGCKNCRADATIIRWTMWSQMLHGSLVDYCGEDPNGKGCFR